MATWDKRSPLDLEKLEYLLKTEPLDPVFEMYGDFVIHQPMQYFNPPRLAYPDNPQMVHFFGNFYNYSHVFNFATDCLDAIGRLTKLIAENKAKPEYQLAKQERQERENYWAERARIRQETKARWHR